MHDVIIIGSGPAGYTAAIYTSRALLSTLIIAGPQPGGQLTTTTSVENFPGFSTGIDANMLLDEMKKQAERFGAKIQLSHCRIVTLSERKTFLVTTSHGELEARAVIVATGASARTLGIPSEEKFRGKGISYCATCDGFFYKDKEVAVVGGGDTAIEEATFLTRFARKVTIIHRRGEFRASKIMVEKAKKNGNIFFAFNKTVDRFYGGEKLEGAALTDVKTGEKTDISADGAFIAIGHTPATGFLKGFIDLDENGYVKTSNTMTSVPGIFAAGDCVDSRYRQAVVAAGMGAMAALDVQKWLEEIQEDRKTYVSFTP